MLPRRASAESSEPSCEMKTPSNQLLTRVVRVPTFMTVNWTGISGLASPQVWIGIVLLAVSFASWLYVLRFLPLSIAFPLSQFVHVLVPIGSWILLGELISTRRWGGIALVVVGIFIVAKPVARMEEKL